MRRFAHAWRRLTAVGLLVAVAAAIVTMPGSWAHEPPALEGEAPAGIPPRWRPLAEDLEAWRAAEPAERQAFMTWLVDVGLESRRRQAVAVVRAQHERRMRTAGNVTSDIFYVLQLLSLLVLLVPLFVPRARAPRRRALWLHAVLATATILGSLTLLHVCTNVLTRSTSALTSLANPEIGLLEAGFDRLRMDVHAQLDALEAGRAPADDGDAAMVMLGAAGGETHGSYAANILQGLRYFDPHTLEPAIVWTRRAWAALSYVPLLVPFAVVFIVLLTMRGTLAGILRMPIAAGQGEAREGRRAIRGAFGFIVRELLSILMLVAALFPAGLLAALAVRRLSHPLISIFLAQTRTTIDYFGLLRTPPEQSELTFGLLAVPGFLALATLLGVGGVTLFGLRARRLIQQKMHRGWPLRRDVKPWRRAIMALLRLQWIPALLLWALAPHLVALHDGTPADAAAALGRMTTMGRQLLVALPLAFVVLGGIGALVHLWPLRRLGPLTGRIYRLRARRPKRDDRFLRRAHHEGLRDAVVATFGAWDPAVQAGYADEWLRDGQPRVILVGAARAGYLELDEAEDHMRVKNIVLLPVFQGHGLGSRILRDVMDAAAARGVPVDLQVLHGNPRARALYERLGFEVAGETAHHVQMRWSPPRG